MEKYNVVGGEGNWQIEHNAAREGNYLTKEAAFEAIAFAASNDIKKDGAERIRGPSFIHSYVEKRFF